MCHGCSLIPPLVGERQPIATGARPAVEGEGVGPKRERN